MQLCAKVIGFLYDTKVKQFIFFQKMNFIIEEKLF